MSAPKSMHNDRSMVLRAVAGRQLTWDELRRCTGIPAKRLRPLLAELEKEDTLTSGFPEDGSVARRWWLTSEPVGYPDWLERPWEEENDEEGDEDQEAGADGQGGQSP